MSDDQITPIEFKRDLNSLSKDELVDIVSKFYDEFDSKIIKQEKSTEAIAWAFSSVKRNILNNLAIQVKSKVIDNLRIKLELLKTT